MHPVENGIYHVRRSGMSVAMEYLRISEQECVELYKASEDKMYFKYLLFDLGIVDRWKRESDELLVELEDLCGKKWVNPYTPEKESYNKFVHEFNGNILKMIGYFRGSEKEGQVFCDMITECIEKYEQRGLYSRGKLNN